MFSSDFLKISFIIFCTNVLEVVASGNKQQTMKPVTDTVQRHCSFPAFPLPVVHQITLTANIRCEPIDLPLKLSAVSALGLDRVLDDRTACSSLTADRWISGLTSRQSVPCLWSNSGSLPCERRWSPGWSCVRTPESSSSGFHWRRRSVLIIWKHGQNSAGETTVLSDGFSLVWVFLNTL